MSILALVPHDMRSAFEQKTASGRLDVVVIETASELSTLAHAGRTFSVAILPASLPKTGLWALWAHVRLLNPRPEILIYAPAGDFSTWSGVLEAGCHDILVEPFSAEDLQIAVTKAEKTFNQRAADGTEECNA